MTLTVEIQTPPRFSVNACRVWIWTSDVTLFLSYCLHMIFRKNFTSDLDLENLSSWISAMWLEKDKQTLELEKPKDLLLNYITHWMDKKVNSTNYIQMLPHSIILLRQSKSMNHLLVLASGQAACFSHRSWEWKMGFLPPFCPGLNEDHPLSRL